MTRGLPVLTFSLKLEFDFRLNWNNLGLDLGLHKTFILPYNFHNNYFVLPLLSFKLNTYKLSEDEIIVCLQWNAAFFENRYIMFPYLFHVNLINALSEQVLLHAATSLPAAVWF